MPPKVCPSQYPTLDDLEKRRTYHIHIENGGSSRNIVLVENTLKLVIREYRAFLEAIATPRLVSPTLVLHELIKLVAF